MVSKFLSALWGRSKSKNISKEDKENNKKEEKKPMRARRPVSEYILPTNFRDSGCHDSPGSSWVSSSYGGGANTSHPHRVYSLYEAPPPSCDSGHHSPSGTTTSSSLSTTISTTASSDHQKSADYHHLLGLNSSTSPSTSLLYSSLPCALDEAAVEEMKHTMSYSWDIQMAGSFPISSTHPDTVSSRLERFRPQQNPKSVQLSVSLLGVEEIEQVLGNAFQAALVRATERRRETPLDVPHKQPKPQQHHATLSTVASTPALVGVFRGMPLEPRQRVSSTAFLSRLLGKGKEVVCTPMPDAENKAKRKRRPVSAVFSSAIHRFSSSANVKDSKRISTIDLGKGLAATPLCRPKPQEDIKSPPLAEPEDTSSTGTQTTSRTSTLAAKEPRIVYDEKLGEQIYLVDETLEKQLDTVGYFCRLPSRESLMTNLLAHPEGAFVVRYSESRRSLALSVRVPLSHNPTGVSHYLLVRNAKGFRIKFQAAEKFFPSIQTLVTHHSVIQEQLPCRLVFVQWKPSDWKDQRKVREREPKELKPIDEVDEAASRRGSRIFPAECDENRNTCFFDEPPPKASYLQMSRDHELMWSTPKRRSRQFVDTRRHSRFIELEQH
ncbi:unnamed protein product, partial [Mesorhabditis spiculigera]